MDIESFAFIEELKIQGYGESDSSGRWVKFEVPAEVLDIIRGSKGEIMEVAARFVTNDGERQAAPVTAEAEKGPYGHWIQKCHRVGFFRSPVVWAQLFSDDDYQEWCRGRKCVVCGNVDWAERNGTRYPKNVYAHVTYAVATPTREGRHPNKVKYSGVGMCNACHQKQHNEGWNAVGGLDLMRQRAMKSIEAMAHQHLKYQFDVDSLTWVSPEMLTGWCATRDLVQYLPRH